MIIYSIDCINEYKKGCLLYNRQRVGVGNKLWLYIVSIIFLVLLKDTNPEIIAITPNRMLMQLSQNSIEFSEKLTKEIIAGIINHNPISKEKVPLNIL